MLSMCDWQLIIPTGIEELWTSREIECLCTPTAHIGQHFMRHSLIAAQSCTICSARAACTIKRCGLSAIGSISTHHATVRFFGALFFICIPLCVKLWHWGIWIQVTLLRRRGWWACNWHCVHLTFASTVEGHPQDSGETSMKLQRRAQTRHTWHIRQMQVQCEASRSLARTTAQEACAKSRTQCLNFSVSIPRMSQSTDKQSMLRGAPTYWF